MPKCALMISRPHATRPLFPQSCSSSPPHQTWKLAHLALPFPLPPDNYHLPTKPTNQKTPYQCARHQSVAGELNECTPCSRTPITAQKPIARRCVCVCVQGYRTIPNHIKSNRCSQGTGNPQDSARSECRAARIKCRAPWSASHTRRTPNRTASWPVKAREAVASASETVVWRLSASPHECSAAQRSAVRRTRARVCACGRASAETQVSHSVSQPAGQPATHG
ncbi:hypothetical protein IWZ03DRAFT_188233 [Phyllosticta citriasiana]|uniref:Uncharacterized protein n=1 Tax=Phyllosticta citriasiana TaxID=595635 RepID=A0ABR1KN76_9PEZI